jgi:hypothetical protein
MLDRLADLLLRSGRVRRFDVDGAPADVLMHSSLVLRGLGATLARLDLDAGTLEARLAVGARLRLRAEADHGARSHVAIDIEGRDWNGVARVLARELAQGGGGA